MAFHVSDDHVNNVSVKKDKSEPIMFLSRRLTVTE